MIKKGLSYLGIFLLHVLSLLPLFVLYKLADLFYLLLYHVFAYRRNVVRQNLINSFPEKQLSDIIAIERKYYRYLGNLIVEILKMTTISEKQIKNRYKFNGTEQLDTYFKQNRSVLICSAHYGNWEWGSLGFGLSISADHYPIYKPLNNPVFDKWFKKIRKRFGNKMVPMRQTIRAINEHQNEACVFSFGNDQSPTVSDIQYWTTFLNQPAAIQLGIEKIARKTNQPIFYLKVKVVERGYYEVDCVPLCLNPKETKPYEITEMHTRFLEKIIKEEPAYWLWSHRRWKHKQQTEVSFFNQENYLRQA